MNITQRQRPLSLTVGVRWVRTCRRLLCRSSWCRVTSIASTGSSSNVCRAMWASCSHAGLSSSANWSGVTSWSEPSMSRAAGLALRTM